MTRGSGSVPVYMLDRPELSVVAIYEALCVRLNITVRAPHLKTL